MDGSHTSLSADIRFHYPVKFLGVSKLDNRQSDVSGRLTGDRQEPKKVDNNRLECPICHQVFSDRPGYDGHWVTCHEDAGLSMASGSMGSMQGSGEGSCEVKQSR